MNANKVRLTIILSSGLFLLLDQFLKWQATHAWIKPVLINRYLGWQLFFNSGVAFSLPVPNSLVIFFTMPMIAIIAFLLARSYLNKKIINMAGWSLILCGAFSNLIDRIFYHHVIDYFLIGTGIINISDVIIVAGLIIFLFNFQKKT